MVVGHLTDEGPGHSGTQRGAGRTEVLPHAQTARGAAVRGRTTPAVTLQCAHVSAPSLRPECTRPQVPAEPFTQRAAHLCQQRGTLHLPAAAPITLDNSTP